MRKSSKLALLVGACAVSMHGIAYAILGIGVTQFPTPTAAPTITSLQINPQLGFASTVEEGPYAGGQEVAIYGTGLIHILSVQFCGANATILSELGSEVLVKTPTAANTDGGSSTDGMTCSVTVTSQFGTATLSSGYYYYPATVAEVFYAGYGVSVASGLVASWTGEFDVIVLSQGNGADRPIVTPTWHNGLPGVTTIGGRYLATLSNITYGQYSTQQVFLVESDVNTSLAPIFETAAAGNVDQILITNNAIYPEGVMPPTTNGATATISNATRYDAGIVQVTWNRQNTVAASPAEAVTYNGVVQTMTLQNSGIIDSGLEAGSMSILRSMTDGGTIGGLLFANPQMTDAGTNNVQSRWSTLWNIP